MPLAPREFAATLLAEARDTHPWLHHRLFRVYYEHMGVEEDHGERAVPILEGVAVTDVDHARGRLALRRAIAARRICAEGMYEAFVGNAAPRT